MAGLIDTQVFTAYFTVPMVRRHRCLPPAEVGSERLADKPQRSNAMSHFLDRLAFFRKTVSEFSNGHGSVSNEDRSWEDGYRNRWEHDKVVRSTHGVNCTGSCSWNVYVKDGIVVWETQCTDYPHSGIDTPDYEPRGCPRGATFSWYIYSPVRVKYPYVRSTLLELWEEALAVHPDPVSAWGSIMADPAKTKKYREGRGKGGLVRVSWDQAATLIAASLI